MSREIQQPNRDKVVLDLIFTFNERQQEWFNIEIDTSCVISENRIIDEIVKHIVCTKKYSIRKIGEILKISMCIYWTEHLSNDEFKKMETWLMRTNGKIWYRSEPMNRLKTIGYKMIVQHHHKVTENKIMVKLKKMLGDKLDTSSDVCTSGTEMFN